MENHFDICYDSEARMPNKQPGIGWVSIMCVVKNLALYYSDYHPGRDPG